MFVRHIHKQEDVDILERNKPLESLGHAVKNIIVFDAVLIEGLTLVVLVWGINFAQLVFLSLHFFLNVLLRVRLASTESVNILGPYHEGNEVGILVTAF
jgi:hypothetical protein